MTPLEMIAVAAGVLLAGLFLATYRHGVKVLSFCIGVSAGFILVQFGGVHLYTMLVIAYVLISRSVRSGALGRVVTLVAVSALFASTALFGDLVKSNGLAVQLCILAVTTGLFILRSADDDLRIAKLGLLAITTVGALTAIAQAVGVLPDQIWQLEGAELHRPSGIYPEPDWLGLYSAAGVVLAFTTAFKRPAWQFVLIAVNAAAVMLASARAAILAVAVVALWALLRSWAAGRSKRTEATTRSHTWRNLGVLAVAGTIAAFVVFPEEVDRLLTRFSNALTPGGGDAVVRARFGQNDALWTLVQSAPLTGHGITASGRVNGVGLIDYTGTAGGTTGSNWLLSMLGEGMLLALPLMVLLIGVALFGNWKLGSGLLLLVLVNSLFSNAVFFPLAWFALALAMIPSEKVLPALDAVEPRLMNVKA